jgi:cardiolipin synthase
LLLGVAFPFLPADWRLPVVIAAAITDGLDGQLSRLMQAQSKLGVLLDPIADKIFFLAVVGTLLWDGSLTWLEVILISLRDVIVVLGGIGAWLRDGGKAWHQMKPRWLGKAVTVLQFAFIAVVLLEPTWSGVSAWRLPLLVATAIVGALSGIDYVWAHVRLPRTGHSAAR